MLIKAGLNGLSRAAAFHPRARELADGVERLRDVPYGPGPAHRLDIYRPRDVRGRLPVLLYLHGGGFLILSKDTHWMFGYGLARRGFVVFNINYRLAPRHVFPAALEDAALALEWVLENAERYGGDPGRLVYAGESAGANLATALAVAGAWRRPEPFARRVFDLDPQPKVAIAACGILEVSRPERYLEREDIPAWMRDRIHKVCRSYLPDSGGDAERYALADPLRVLESDVAPERPLPAFFAPCGGADPIAEDTRRLGRALERRGVPSSAPIYPRGFHAFHAVFWDPLAERCWRDQDAFLAEHL